MDKAADIAFKNSIIGSNPGAFTKAMIDYVNTEPAVQSRNCWDYVETLDQSHPAYMKMLKLMEKKRLMELQYKKLTAEIAHCKNLCTKKTVLDSVAFDMSLFDSLEEF